MAAEPFPLSDSEALQNINIVGCNKVFQIADEVNDQSTDQSNSRTLNYFEGNIGDNSDDQSTGSVMVSVPVITNTHDGQVLQDAEWSDSGCLENASVEVGEDAVNQVHEAVAEILHVHDTSNVLLHTGQIKKGKQIIIHWKSSETTRGICGYTLMTCRIVCV